MANISLRNTRPRHALLRLRARAWPILQTALAVVGSWYLALLLLPTDRPVFASIAAVIAIGATYGQRRERAIELIGGVVLGIGLADLLVTAIGSGPLQLGVMVILAMSLAVALGGGPVLVTEAAVSAILLVVLEPSGAALPPTRLIEALVGGGVALAISALAFPLNPVLLVSRSVHDVFGRLGRTLEQVSSALDERDEVRALAALEDARELDGYVRAFDDALVLGRETARFSPGRRSSLGELNRYERSAPHIDLAVRNARMLTRHVLRFLRSGGSPPRGSARRCTTWARPCGRLRPSSTTPLPTAPRHAGWPPGRPRRQRRASRPIATSPWPRSWWGCAPRRSTCSGRWRPPRRTKTPLSACPRVSSCSSIRRGSPPEIEPAPPRARSAPHRHRVRR